MKSNIRLWTLVGTCLATAGAFAVNSDFDKSGCVLGRWTSDLTAAQKKVVSLKAAGSDPLILVDLTKNDGSCGYCNTADRNIYDKQDFKDWAKEQEYALCIADYASGSSASSYVMSNWNTGFSATPVFIVVDGDGETRLGYTAMHGGTVTSGQGTITTGKAPKKGFFINLDTMGKDTVSGLVDYILNQQDDKPYAKTPTGAGKQRNPTARVIYPDSRTSSVVTTNGLWGASGLNGLCNINMYYKETRLQSVVSDQYDWFCFENEKAGTAYEMKATALTGDYVKADAMVCFYRDLPAAQKVSTYASACTVANDPATGYGAYPLGDILNGLRVTVEDAGTVYMLVTRRDAASKEDIDIHYAFSMKEANACTYHFLEGEYATIETNRVLRIPLARTSGESEGVVRVTSMPVETATSVAANQVPGHPDFELKDGTIVYAAGETVKYVELTIYESATNSLSGWYPDRTLELSLDAPSETQGFPTTTVCIRDADKTPQGAEGEYDTTRATAETVALNEGFADGNVYFVHAVATNWLKFAVGAGKGCRVALIPYPLVGLETVDYAFYRGTSTEPFEAGTLAADELGWIVFASDEDETVYLRLSRASSDSNLYGVCYYGVEEFTRPEVGFDGGATKTAYRSEKKCDFTVVREDASAGILVNWRAYAGPGDTAVDGVDFTAKEGQLLFGLGENVMTGSVDILRPESFVAHPKTFTIELQSSDSYVLGDDAKIAVTITADKSGNDDGATPGDAHPVALDGEAWATAGKRNVSGLVAEDWISVGPVAAGEAYRLSAANVSLQPADTAVTVTLVTNGVPSGFSWSLSDLAVAEEDAPCLTLPADYAGDRLMLRVARPAGETVIAEYELKACHWIKPVFSFAQAAESVTRDDLRTWSMSVDRAENLTGLDTVVVFADGIDARTLTFNPGEKNVTEGVVLVDLDDGIWFGDHDYTLKLALSRPGAMATGEPATEALTLTDTVPEWETVGGQKDDADESAENPLVSTRLEDETARWSRTLHGADTDDWFVFRDVTNGTRYVISLTNVIAGVNGATLKEGAYGQLGLAVVITEPESAPVTNSVTQAAALFSLRPKACGDLTIQLLRTMESTEDKPVSVAYDLAVTKVDMAPSRVCFAECDVEVSELASAVYLDVVCTTEGGQALDADASVWVVPVRDDEAAYPAEPVEDFDPKTTLVTWEKGTTGGVRRVSVALTNYDSTWEGDERFRVELQEPEETELLDAVSVAHVTIIEKDPAAYGTVGVVAYGTDRVREGDAYALTFLRQGGKSGAVTASFTWSDGTKENVTLYADRETGLKTVTVKVPTEAGFQTERTLKLGYALTVPAKTVMVTKGTPTSFAVQVTDKDWGDKLSAYSEKDLSKIGFRTSGTAWFVDADGCLRAAPNAGVTSLMEATVTGPGTVRFDALVASGTTLTVLVNGKEAKTLNYSAVDASVRVDGTGSSKVSFSFSRPAGVKDASACCVVSDVRFERDAAANAYGTFKGAVSVEDVPGFATLTVSLGGRFSGRLSCADRVWTFVGDDGWNGDMTKELTAKSGAGRMTLVLTADPAARMVALSAKDAEVAGSLARDVWRDKPLAAADGAALAAYDGYYTVALPQSLDPAASEGYGSGYLTLTISENGTVKAAGLLADGTSVQASGLLTALESDVAETYLFVAPSAYRHGWFLLPLRLTLNADGAPVTTVRVEEAVRDLCRWANLAEDCFFKRNPLVSGGWYDKTENLHAHYTDGLKLTRGDSDAFAATVVFNEAGTRLSVSPYDGLLSTSFRAATGLLTGYIRNYVDESMLRKESHVYRAVMTPNTADGFAVGRGYFKADATTSVDIAITDVQ